ncbi:MAG: DUF1343 domain-containing protein [Ignavibacteria bacterium]|nr:DUF1343 domain-containing protein [Ignavibacteria bacterium]
MIIRICRIVAFVLIGTIYSHAHQMNFESPKVMLGIDILRESKFEIVRGMRVGLLTNYTGRASTLESTAEIFSQQSACTLTAIFTPEHGFYTTVPAGDAVENDSLFGVPAYSLYGKNRRPTWSMLKNIDVMVIDIQDIGIRSYTYISSMLTTMDACAETGKRVIILDRPNPLGGLLVDGNVADTSMLSFVSFLPIPYLHGLTICEIAVMANECGWLPKDKQGNPRKAKLEVVKMSNWHRAMTWETTGLAWLPTSPNIPTPNAIRGAAMTGVLGELSLVSIGIGTTLPFQYIGLPQFTSVDCTALGKILPDSDSITGIPTKFRASSGKYASKDCTGLLLTFHNLYTPKLFTAGINLVLELRKIRPEMFEMSSVETANMLMFKKVTGSKELYSLIFNKGSDDAVRAAASRGLEDFLPEREKFLLYTN